MGQAGMKNNWKRNTRYMGVFAVLAAVFCMIVVLNINTGNVQISVPEILRILFLKKGTQVQMNIIWKIRLPRVLMAGIPDFYCRHFFPTRSQDRMYWGFLRVQR